MAFLNAFAGQVKEEMLKAFLTEQNNKEKEKMSNQKNQGQTQPKELLVYAETIEKPIMKGGEVVNNNKKGHTKQEVATRPGQLLEFNNFVTLQSALQAQQIRGLG